MDIQWLGHPAFRIAAEGKNVLVDPYFSGNPTCPPNVEKNLGRINHILVTHGHGDHLGDRLKLAKEHDAQVVCIAEINAWLQGHGHSNSASMNIGGTVSADGFSFTMVNALPARRPTNVVVVAMANKTARIVWATLSRGETFRTEARAAA